MIIKVEQKHIDNGVLDNSCKCPIALAMIDAKMKDPEIHYDKMSFKAGGRYARAETSPTCRKFMSKFDTGHKVEPFEFELILK
jgi:hypothetical protein